MEFEKLTLFELVEGIKQQKFTSEQVVKYFIKRVEEQKSLNAIIEVFDDVIEKAKVIDEKIKSGKPVGKLAGLPVAIKDNIAYKGKKLSCSSAFMQGYVSPYSATIVKKLEAEDAIIFGRTNMDEFAMGGSCEKSVYGPTKNAYNSQHVAGGSSGGSAVAVAAGLCPVAIGTDTGGSVRQPSSFNGVVGVKPTYGTVSRYGLVAFASSTDQAGPITKTVEECEFVLKIIAGKDELDQTSIQNTFGSVKVKQKYTIGIIKQLKDKISDLPSSESFNKSVETLKGLGYEFVEVDVPHFLNSLACYYILATAEAASNLSRFDGLKYAVQSKDAKTLEDVYVKSRSEGFGTEVKHRIMLGNFVLSSGYYDAYYRKAQKLQSLLKKEFALAFEKCDAIITPTTPGEAFKIGEISDPVTMYLEDLFTVPPSITGLPGLSVPCGVGVSGLPLGLQLIGKEQSETVLFDIAKKFIKEGK